MSLWALFLWACTGSKLLFLCTGGSSHIRLFWLSFFTVTHPCSMKILEFFNFEWIRCWEITIFFLTFFCPSYRKITLCGILLSWDNLGHFSGKRLPGCLLAVLPSFENSLILLPLCCMTHGWASAHLLYSINNGIMAFRNLGNTASKQLGRLSVIFTKMSINQWKIVRFSIQTHCWKGICFYYIVLYKGTTYLLEKFIQIFKLCMNYMIVSPRDISQ